VTTLVPTPADRSSTKTPNCLLHYYGELSAILNSLGEPDRGDDWECLINGGSADHGSDVR
jgi:hypothetical protein